MSFFKMAIQNLMKRRGRTALTIIAIALSGALLTGIWILNYSYSKSYEVGVSKMLGYTDIGIARHLNTSNGLFTEEEIMSALGIQNQSYYERHTSRINFMQTFTPFENNIEKNAFSTLFIGINNVTDRGFGYCDFLNVSEDVKAKIGSPKEIEDILSIDPNYLVISTWVASVFNLTLDDEIMVLSKNTTRARDGLINSYNSSTWDRFLVKAIILDQGEGEVISYNIILNESSHYLNSQAIYLNCKLGCQIYNVSETLRNQLFIGVKLSELQTAEQYLAKKLPKDGAYYLINIKEDRLSAVRNNVQSMMMILIIFTIISVIVAIMLIINTLMMNIQEQKYETSVLRAIGVYKEEVFQLFFSQALFLALIGSILGALLGMGLCPLFKILFFNKLGKDADFVFRIYYRAADILSPMGINLLITALVGVFPAYISTKIQIIEALRNLPSSKKEGRAKKLIFPFVSAVVVTLSYLYLKDNERQLTPSLIGIIPFILGILALTTILIPILSKLISYLMSWLLSGFRQLTERNFGSGENKKKVNVTFMMFATAIAFLVMVSNVLISIRNIQVRAIPRHIGNDLVMYSEGSTFGMDEMLVNDQDYIQNCIKNASVFNRVNTKVNNYGSWWSDRRTEPKVWTYIIEPLKFLNANYEITLDQPSNSKENVRTAFTKLENETFNIIVNRQLADAQHLNLEVGDKVKVSFTPTVGFNFTVVAIVDFVAGVEDTWANSWEVIPAESSGQYSTFVSWETITTIIDEIYEYLPDLHFAIKADDHDTDFWDMPIFNATTLLSQLQPYINNGTMKVSERVWDNETTSALLDSSYSWTQISVMTPEQLALIAENVHVAFERPNIKGMATFIQKRNASWNTVQEALQDGTDQCVITNDISTKLGLGIDDNMSIWHENYSSPGSFFRKNFTIAGIINISQTLEAFNFDAMNPYIPGNNDVAADDSTAVIVDFSDEEFRRNILNHTLIYEVWVELSDYYKDHLRLNKELRKLLGPDFVLVDVYWYYTMAFAYAPYWIIDLKDDISQDDAIGRIKQYLLANQMPVIGWYNSKALQAQYQDQMEFQKAFFNVILAFALIISVLGIIINMLMSIASRRREIGILRAIGTQKGEIMKMILGETFILTLTGLVLGTGVGTLCSLVLLRGLPLDTVFQIWLSIDWLMIELIGVIVIVISIVASLFPARNAMNINVVEAVREL